MLINVTIECRESDCRAPQVLIEAKNNADAAEKIIKIAKSMRPECEFYFNDDKTFGGKEYTFIYMKDPESLYGFPIMIGRILKQEETPVELIKRALLETEEFDIV